MIRQFLFGAPDGIEIEADQRQLTGGLGGTADHLDQRVNNPRAGLDLDEQPLAVGDGLDHLCEGWDPDPGELRPLPASSVQRAQLGQGVFRDHPIGVGGAVRRFIVNHDDLAIAGQVDIQLRGIGVDFGAPGVGESREGILGRGIRLPLTLSGAAVSNDLDGKRH